MRLIRCIFLFGIGLVAFGGGQEGSAWAIVGVGEILESPRSYLDEKVEIEGFAERRLEQDRKSTQFYMLRDDYGNPIPVRSSEGYPAVGTRYRVAGYVNLHPDTKQPFIGELKRTLAGPQAEEAAPARPEAPASTPSQRASVAPSPIHLPGRGGLVAGIAVLVVAMGVGVVSLAKRKRGMPGGSRPAPARKDAGATQVFETSMIKVETSPATTKFMPGTLELLSGEKVGEKIRIQGYPTPEGAETTIGREEVTGDRRFAHILLKQPTVSREQARLIYDGAGYRLANLGATNPTQVNGRELSVNENVRLSPGDTIRFGEVGLRFEA